MLSPKLEKDGSSCSVFWASEAMEPPFFKTTALFFGHFFPLSMNDSAKSVPHFLYLI
jgi:hypothetical protein